MGRHTYQKRVEGNALTDDLLNAGVPVLYCETNDKEVSVTLDEERETPAHEGIIARVVRDHNPTEARAAAKRRDDDRGQLRGQIEALGRGSGTMTTAQLTEAVRLLARAALR